MAIQHSIMGDPMSHNLINAGYRLVVHEKQREAAMRHLDAGAIWADTPRALASQCEVMFSCLPGLPEIEAVALGSDGVIAGIRPRHAYFEMSTNSPELVKQLRAAFADRGAHMLDAPISGGGPGAPRKRLAIWIAIRMYELLVKAL